MAILTSDQDEFLNRHSISVSSVFDATGLRKNEYREIMKSLGKIVAIGVTACKKGGHTLRSRSGHCVQCNPAALGFQARFSATGFVYIAGSLSLKVIKVGFSGDVKSRISSLNHLNYGGASDWVCIYWIQCESAGNIEFGTHARLVKFAAPTTYIRDGKPVNCLETFSCEAETAISTLNEIEPNPADSWSANAATLMAYQFESITGSIFIRKSCSRSLGAATPNYRSKAVDETTCGTFFEQKAPLNMKSNEIKKVPTTTHISAAQYSINTNNEKESKSPNLITIAILSFISFLALFMFSK